ncbi:MAG: hypothetical protein NVS3B25_31310 [Hymenobacter sp.]
MAQSLADFFRRYDAGRRPELLPVRYHRMQANAFAFFRGSAPWFYEVYGREARLRDSPLAWLCGDAHVENFGSYRGGNGLVYFDANDFDEAVRGPLLWDVARLAVSVLLAGAYLGLSPAQRQAAARTALAAYAATLATGKPFLLERDTATGVVRQFITTVAHRRRRDLLRARARRHHGWSLRPGATLCPLPKAERQDVLAAVESWRRAQEAPPCGPVLDVAQRVAGVGSLGVPRYLVLAEHRQPRKRPVLLDFKLALPPASRSTGVAQPRWPSEAHRVVQAQTWMQALPPALLQAVSLGGQPFVLRALQPVADKLDFSHFAHSKATFRAALPDFARLLAWAHLRGAGRHGAAVPDVLQAYGTAAHWQEGVLNFAVAAAVQVTKDFRAFRAACRAGALPTAPRPGAAT